MKFTGKRREKIMEFTALLIGRKQSSRKLPPELG